MGRLIGAGGMGEVYLAEDEVLQRKVALKLLPARFTQDQERVRRFQREARAASALNHPNILTIYEIGHADSVHYIATEYIEGQTLREVMASRRLTIAEVIDIATGVANALAAAHDAGIVHRDIKPENIMLRPDGYVKVLDFGLAKLMDDAMKDSATGQVLGWVAASGAPRRTSPLAGRAVAISARPMAISNPAIRFRRIAPIIVRRKREPVKKRGRAPVRARRPAVERST